MPVGAVMSTIVALHTPLLQVPEQTFPQEPQFSGSVRVLTSQPLSWALLSQFANPALHTRLQLPREQVALPFVLLHTVPHAPQWLVLVWVEVSQPLALLPSQLPYPGLHTGEQEPDTHEVVPLGLTHAAPHAPQLFSDVANVVSQPLTGLASQFPKPEMHEGEQTPEAHEVVPWGLVQAMPHAPQFAISELVAVSQPLAGLTSQSPHPDTQVGEHTPETHCVEPCWFAHAVPHAPQLLVLLPSAVSQPFATFPSQLP